MAFGKFRFSKTKKREFANKMTEIEQFCVDNGISSSMSMDSYYFTINGLKYRVSNHTIAASNRKAFSFTGEQVREKYHRNDEEYICITAGKTRIIEIYNDLKAGKKLDKRGNVVE